MGVGMGSRGVMGGLLWVAVAGLLAGGCESGWGFERADFACGWGGPCPADAGASPPGCTTGASCDDGKPCTVYACDAATGTCSGKPAADGATCGSGKGQCDAGACTWTDGKGRKWGLVPSGTFWMGCNLDKGCDGDEKPQHKVTITKPFWLGLYEVTVGEHQACVDAGACTAPSTYSSYCNWGMSGRLQHPVNCVNWKQSAAYCEWAGGWLPTEAQWELAARGRCEENGGVSGCKSKMRVYPWGNTSPMCGKHAVFYSGGYGCGKKRTWAVGTGSGFGRGPYGHYDLAGNVWEWVRDWYSPGYYQVSSKQDPVNTSGASRRVERGGGFGDDAADLRAGIRGVGGPSVAFDALGLRCARSFP